MNCQNEFMRSIMAVIGMMMKLARNTGLVSEIDRRVHLLKVHAPYQESDHVMAHVLNMLSGGTRLEHLELLRQRSSAERGGSRFDS
jgi:hypothetical protein